MTPTRCQIAEHAVDILARNLAIANGEPSIWLALAVSAVEDARAELEDEEQPARVKAHTAVTVAGIGPVERIVVR